MTNSKEPNHQPLLIQGNISDSFTNRRKVIGSLGLATAGFCASSIPASAGWFWKKDGGDIPVVKVKTISGNLGAPPSKNVGGFPEEWVRLQGNNLTGYTGYINSLKLRNISAQDVISAHAKERGPVWNMLPPRQWWPRMGYTLRVIDRISSEMNVPVKEIVSAYRSPDYNARCRGAKTHSWHQANVAADVQFDTSARNVTQAARSLRDRGLFKGGIGGYSGFTHIDTRGTNVNW